MLLKKVVNEMMLLVNEIQQTGSHVVLYGASDAGRNYACIMRTYNIPIVCFIDDDVKKQNRTCCGIEVLSLETFIKKRIGNEIILIASYSPSVIMHKLKERYPFLYKQVRWSDFYLWENELDYFQYFQDNMEQIDKVFGLLCDEKSRHVFANLLNYKISRNPKLIEEVQDSAKKQYFTAEIMKFTDNEVFVDLGAYSGDTVKEFSSAVKGKYGRIIAVEPDETNFVILKANTKTLLNVDYYQAGVAEKEGMARFHAEGLYTSHFDEKGEQEIRTLSVDSIMMGAEATFIKADIEGLEMEMLKGAQNTIKIYKPKIAIAVYHKKEDIFNIPLLLYSYRSDYKFFMRHYTEMPIDTVLYAV